MLKAKGSATSTESAKSTCFRTLTRPGRDRRAGEDAPGISFLKEQQWSLDFGTAVVKEQAVRESIRVPARLEARPGGAADVVAPIDGRLTRVVDVPLGERVAWSGARAAAAPPPRRATFRSFSGRERKRRPRSPGDARPRTGRTLTSAGAAPAKRLDEARSARNRPRPVLPPPKPAWRNTTPREPAAPDAEGLPRSGAGERRDRPAQRRDGCQCFRGNRLVSRGRCITGPRRGAGSGSGGGARPTARAAEIEIAGQPDRLRPVVSSASGRCLSLIPHAADYLRPRQPDAESQSVKPSFCTC